MIDANRIKDRLRACKTAQEVHAVADEERAAVIALHKAGGDDATQAIQISNLKAVKLADLRG